jgi:hypothetical protein
MEVEESGGRRAPEAVDDAWRCADERVRREELLVVIDENGKASFQDVEGIGVLPVEMRARTRLRGIEMRFGDAELLEVGLDQYPAAEEGLTLAWSEHDPVHCDRV